MVLTEAKQQHTKERTSAIAICISVAWGSGKSFAWSNFSTSNPEFNPITISLFGTKSIENLEDQVLTNSFEKTDAQAATRQKTGLDSVLSGITQLIKNADSDSGTIVSIFGKYANTAARDFLRERLRGRTICFDDVERRNSSFSLIDLLGYTTALKERFGANIVLILNDEKLGDTDQKILSDFNEKVLNFQLKLIPSIQDLVTIGLGAQDWARNALTPLCEALNLRSIRVIQRIARILSELPFGDKSVSIEVKEKIAKSITVIAWAMFDRTGERPSLDELLKYDAGAEILFRSLEKKKGDETPQRTWQAMLDAIWWRSDEVDCLLAQWIFGAEMDVSEFQCFLTSYAIDDRRKRLDSEMRRLWELQVASLNPDDEELIVNEYKSLVQNSFDLISFGNIKAIGDYLVDIGRKDDYDALLQSYANGLAQLPENHRARNQSIEFGDPKIEAVLSALIAKKPKYSSIAEVIAFFSEHGNGWNRDEEKFLEDLTIEDWDEFLKDARYDGLLSEILPRIRRCYEHIYQRGSRTERSPLDSALLKLEIAASSFTKNRISKLMNTQ